MGLRGPGAKKRKAAAAASAASGPRRKPSWQWSGLSRAERVIRFLQTLPITSGMHAGRKFKPRDWQCEIVRSIYATDDDGRRIVRTALITLPRKNGKSFLAAGLVLAHLVGPEAEPRGQIVSAAADREQAALIFNEIEAIVNVVDWMGEVLNVQRFMKKIEHLENGSVYLALSSEAKTKHGLSASVVIYDELAQAPNRDLFDVLETSVGAREEPLLIVISTQSPDPLHVMSEIVQDGLKVISGEVVDPTFHATIYVAPDEADPWDEATWHACNPALGDFRSLTEMRKYAATAMRIPNKEATFRSLYLNQPVSADERFVTEADWRACGGDCVAKGPCYGGLDLGSVRDLTAFVLFFPETGAVRVWSWVPSFEMAERERRDKVPFRVWISQGILEVSGDRATDWRTVAHRLDQICRPFDVQEIAFDRWRIEDLKNTLAAEDIELPLTEFGQGFASMGPAVEELERLILSERLRHGDNPLLTWTMANAAIETDPTGARKFSKRRAIARIDALVAMTMAIGIAAKAMPTPPVGSIYDTQAVL